MRRAVERHCSTNYLRISPVVAAPHIIGQNHDLRRIGAGILFGECAAQLRIHTECFKETAGGAQCHYIFRPLCAAENCRVRAESGHALKASAARAPVVEGAGADAAEVRMRSWLIAPVAPVVLPRIDQPVRISVWKWFEQHTVKRRFPRSEID